MSEPERPWKRKHTPHDRAAAIGARDAVQGNNDKQNFNRLVDAVRQSLLINQEPEDTFAAGVEAEKHWRDDLCPNGENHGLGPYIPPKPATRKLNVQEPGEVVEFHPHHVAMFEVMTEPVTASFVRFLKRLYRRDVAFGWAIEWWKWIVGCIGAGWAYAQIGHEHLPDIKVALTWILAHLQ